jgi:hypothetical protein
VLVNTLATDLKLNILEQPQTNVLGPVVEGGNLRYVNLKPNTVNQITVAANLASDALVKAKAAIESLLDRLHGEVSVTPVDDLKESDLRVTS